MARARRTEGDRPALSAVVFGYHDEDTVLRAVRSLVEQESSDPFEVIVATSGGDRTAELVRNAFPDVKVAESPTRLLPGGVRNLGASLATGDTVAFLEADCVARPGWVRTRIALHREGHEAVASSLDAMTGYKAVDRASLYLVHPARLAGHRAGPANEYQGYGLSFTRELLERAGPFDATLRSYEDTAMAERLRSLGVAPWFEPAVCIEHDGPGTLRRLVRDQYARGARDSWAELLRLPSGTHRHRWEVFPVTRALVVALRAAYRLFRRVQATTAALRSGRAGARHELPLLVVPMALGLLAFQLGWARDQLRATRDDRQDRPRDVLPAPRGFRRWVTTDGERVVTLTFDGLPPASKTTELIGMLRDAATSAAFFVAGSDAEERADDVRALAGAGHLIGTLGWSGDPLTSLSDDALAGDLRRSADLLERLTGSPLRHARPPGGHYDWRVVTEVEAAHLHLWLWTTHPQPPLTGPASDLATRALAAITPGAVLALAFGAPADADAAPVLAAIPRVAAGARARGYRVVSLDYLPPTAPIHGPADPAPHRRSSSSTGVS